VATEQLGWSHVAHRGDHSSLFVGYRMADYRVQSQEGAVAASMLESIDRLLTAIRFNERKLAGLAGRPCAEVKGQLTLTDIFVPYLRWAMLVRDGRLYCSTILGPRSAPLSEYLIPSGAAQQIAFLGGSTLMPHIPIMVVYQRIDARNGILYVVEGASIADILARAKASGAQSASVSGGSGGTLTSDGRWLQPLARLRVR
jgi:hypothetical protein